MSQIGELRDGYYRILSYFREKFNDDGEYLRKNLSKDTFNFNTTVNQKEGDEWDF